MTYKELVDSFKTIAEDHYIISDFGYGDITDIKSPADGTNADYPYMFLNPSSHTRTERSVIYRFNLIMMEMVLDDDYLNIQSICQQYIDDVLAEIKLGTSYRFDINIQVTLTPFKERFQDEVAGMTAQIEVEIPFALNLCVAPIQAPPQFVLDVESDDAQLFRPDLSQSPQKYPVTTVDIFNGMRPDAPYNFYNIYAPTTGDWIFTETGTATKISGVGIPFVNPRILTVRTYAGIETQILPTTTTFPDDAPIVQPFDYKCTWDIQLDPAEIQYVAVQDADDAATEPQYETGIGTKLTATYRPL